MKERLKDIRETIAVKWFMLDAQQKQAVIIIVITLWQGIIEVLTDRAKRRAEKKDSEI